MQQVAAWSEAKSGAVSPRARNPDALQAVGATLARGPHRITALPSPLDKAKELVATRWRVYNRCHGMQSTLPNLGTLR